MKKLEAIVRSERKAFNIATLDKGEKVVI